MIIIFYENIEEFYKKSWSRTIFGLHDTYNFQGTIILCEIIESCMQMMIEKYRFNPRKCLSSSTLSGCIHRKMSKAIIPLPANIENVEVSKKILIRDFSRQNTRLAFDSYIFLPKNKHGTRTTNLSIL